MRLEQVSMTAAAAADALLPARFSSKRNGGAGDEIQYWCGSYGFLWSSTRRAKGVRHGASVGSVDRAL
jgi:hypothetical protein